MTAPDPTAPTAEDVIAAALAEVQWRHQDAAAVVAAIRGMTLEQQAELLDGYVEVPVLNEPLRRPVGPWRRVEP